MMNLAGIYWMIFIILLTSAHMREVKKIERRR